MPDDKTTLERISALEQKVSTEQAMRVALLTDITARIDMLEHRAGDVPPADPASEAPLTRAEAEEIAKTCARAAAALPEAPSYLTTVNMRGWRPHAWVVDAVVTAAGRSRLLTALSDEVSRDQAVSLRIAKIVGVYRDDDDEYELDLLLGMLEAKMAELRRDASSASDAHQSAIAAGSKFRDQRNAMRAERDQALARVRELLLEQQLDAGCMGCVAYEQQIADLQQRLAQASTDTVQAMESAASAAARVQELERDNQALRERHDQLFAGAQQADQAREAEHTMLTALRDRVAAAIGVSYEHDEALLAAIAKLKAESIADIMAKLEALREQVTNMRASQSWLNTYETMLDKLADALGMARRMWTEQYMIDRVRELAAKAAIGAVHE